MNRPQQFFRVVYINWIMARYGMDQFVLQAPGLHPWRFLSYFNPWHWVNKKQGRSRGEQLRIMLEKLGPIFVKFGQVLSTRQDLLPDDVAIELAKLQDKVPPFSGKIAIEIIEKTYGKSIKELFADFEIIPLASASISQVHTATLHNGKSVVVKVLRPNILKTISQDVSLMYLVAGLVEKFSVHGPRLRPREVVAEFERVIIDELDLMREAANASQLKRNFAHSDLLYVPEVYWEYARPAVVVFEKIEGIAISDVATLKQQGYDLKKLAERGVEIFLTQVFRDSFFHADMHPGNIFVSKKDPQNPHYIGVDFGIMGSLSPADQRYLAENLLAFFQRDYRRVAVLHVESGWVPANTRIEDFESTIRAVCEPIFARPLKDISFGQLLLRLFQTARRFHMQVQPQLLLLEKTLLNIEGLGRELYPELDLWAVGKPFIERWMRKQTGPRAFLRTVKQRSPMWWRQLAELPDLIYQNAQAQKNYYQQQKAIEPQKLKRKKLPLLLAFLAGVGVTLFILFLLQRHFL